MQQGKKVDTQEVIKILENSPQKGDDKILIGAENLNAEVIAWAIDNNKKIPINTLDETKAKQLGFKTMYFERGILDDEKFNKLLKK